MPIYFFSGGVQSDEIEDLRAQLLKALPDMKVLTKISDHTAASDARSPQDPAYIIFPIPRNSLPLDRVISVAEQDHPGTFYIFISKEISASEYKRLTKSGGADWVSWNGAAEEIADLLARRMAPSHAASSPRRDLFIAGFVPSAGGVGNTTLALETAIQLKLNKETRHLRICLLDLNLQTSNVCDYLDIEPRLKIDEIAKDPDRLDDQLFEVFVSTHQSGVHVLAAPRRRGEETVIGIAPLDALFRLVAKRYDVLVVDLPVLWFDWTPQIISVCDVALITGLNSVPGLRQVADTAQFLKDLQTAPKQVAVALGRCQTTVLRQVARRHHPRRVLSSETIFYIREDNAAATHAANTGVALAVSAPSGRISKDIRRVTDFVAAAHAAQKPKTGREKVLA
jgi:pilus assembly protein CpaE